MLLSLFFQQVALHQRCQGQQLTATSASASAAPRATLLEKHPIQFDYGALEEKATEVVEEQKPAAVVASSQHHQKPNKQTNGPESGMKWDKLDGMAGLETKYSSNSGLGSRRAWNMVPGAPGGLRKSLKDEEMVLFCLDYLFIFLFIYLLFFSHKI